MWIPLIISAAVALSTSNGSDATPGATSPATAPAATSASARVRLLVLGIQPRTGVTPEEAASVASLVASELSTYPALDVVSSEDVRRMIELEGEKQTLGCTDSSCLAEIAGAMGARLVVSGDIGKLGDALLLNVTLFDTAAATIVARQTVQPPSLGAVPNVIRPALRALVQKPHDELGIALPPPAGAATSGAHPPSLRDLTLWSGAGLAIAGIIAVVPGAISLAVYEGAKADLQDEQATWTASKEPATLVEIADAWATAEAARTAWNGGQNLLAIGGAGLAVVGVGLLTTSFFIPVPDEEQR